MANVFLACEANILDHPFARRDYERLVQFSALDSIRKHLVCSDPSKADVIAFIGSAKANFADITSSRLYKEHKQKSVIFYSGDKAIPTLPGVYTCLENRTSIRWRKSLQAGCYLRVADNDSLDINESLCNAKYLFSFVGNAKNHVVREKICALVSHQAILRDSSLDSRQQCDGISGENADRGILYRDAMANSKFILCPRGIGVSSWRLFESMRAGRVPVIISDDWMAPAGPRWSEFAIFIKESEVHSIPAVLENYEANAVALGAFARREWEKWYSKERVFTTVVDQLIAARQAHLGESRISRMVTYAQYLEPFYVRHWILSPLKSRIKSKIIGSTEGA
jgi:hypothetical protein